MRNFILSVAVILIIASMGQAAPLIYTIGFDTVDLKLEYNTATAKRELEFLSKQRVSTVTYDDNTQVPFSNLEILLTTTLQSSTPISPGNPQAKAVFSGGTLEVNEYDATGTVLIRNMLKVNLDKLYAETTTTQPKELLVATAEFDSPTGAWASQTAGPIGEIFILGWYLPLTITDFDTDVFVRSDTSMQITFVPEPATMGLLAIGGVALLKRRRK
jgi:hypothetical protein